MPNLRDNPVNPSRAQLREGSGQVDLEVEVAQLARRVEQLEHQLAQNRLKVDALYQSRIWRILSSFGGAILRLDRLFRSARSAGGRIAASSENINIYPLFPPTEQPATLRGSVEIRGQVVALRGLRSVSIQIGREEPVQASVAVPPGADSPVYSWIWDTSYLPEGRTEVRIVAHDNAGEEVVSIAKVNIDPHFRIEYDRWIKTCEREENRKWIGSPVDNLPDQPLISIVCPVYRLPLPLLRQCLESVLSQIYPNWELRLVDDGSGDPRITALLAEYAARDARIHFQTRQANGGISEATNDGLRTSRGSWLAFLDCDDELPPHALVKVADAIDRYPEIDLFYSDEDKIDERGRRYEPFFKPDWSPDLFLSCNYLCHFVVMRRELFERTGFLAESYRQGSQDYEYLLRATEENARIKRIPGILYHWRSRPGSTARSTDDKPGAIDSGKRALEEHLERTSPGATVEVESLPGRYRVRYPITTAGPVSILIAAGGNVELLSACVESVFRKTAYRYFEIVLIDNSRGNAVEEFAGKAISRGLSLRWLDSRNEPFNYSALNNRAVKHTDAPFLLFLNDDTTVDEPGWLGAMVEHAQRDAIGAVGALLLYPNGAIQHAGVVMGLSGNCDHVFRGSVPHPALHFGLPLTVRNVSAATAACLMVRRNVFEEAGGFDERRLAVAFQDVDLCLRLGELGYRIVVTPHARLWHHESATKVEKIPNPLEVAWMQRRWAAIIAGDPLYNPNLTVTGLSGGLRTCVVT